MSTFRSPVGPQSSGVYWRRRLAVLIGLIAIIVIIVLIVSALNSSTKKTSSPPASPSPSSSTSASNSATNGAHVSTCIPSVITVDAVTDKASYAAGQQPLLSMAITNTGTVACTLSAGSDVQVYTITSGSETIWTSKDCQTNPVTQITTLEPGVPKAATPFPWDRTRSSKTTCTGSRPAVIAGGASYHLAVAVGDIVSKSTKQFILN